MNYLDSLPIEILHEIAHDSEPAYHALITAYPRFAREVTPGRRIDYMVDFGYDVRFKVAPFYGAQYEIIWYRNNVIHRKDGPAVIGLNGDKLWYRDGKIHREDGPAIERGSGEKAWYRDDKIHRDDGPAMTLGGAELWYRDGKLHREDGPAVIGADGSKGWYINNHLRGKVLPTVQRANREDYSYRNRNMIIVALIGITGVSLKTIFAM